MKIREVEKITGLTAKAIRLYEEKGLIRVSRQDNSYRDYSEDVIEKLKLIRILRDLDVPLSQIRLHFNGIMTLEELLNDRKAEMEKENIFHRESYDKCVRLIHELRICDMGIEEPPVTIDPAKALLGLDIGTTNLSAVLLEEETGKVLETYVVSNASRLPTDSDLAECDVDWIVNKAVRMVENLVKMYPNTKCIGITGQMHGMLYISDTGKALSPFYTWQDGRGNRSFSEETTYSAEITARTGYICNTGYAFSTLFYNACGHMEPSGAHSFCTIMDYVAMCLTGRKSPLIHPSNAASFGLYDIQNHCFDRTAIQRLGLSHLTLPEIAENKDKTVGYYQNIPVNVAIGDNPASFFGSVKNEKESVLVNIGTGSQVSMVVEHYQTVPEGLEIRPYLFGKYLICGSALCGGKAYALLERFFSDYAKALLPEATSQYELMNRLAKEAYANGHTLSVSTLFCGTRKEPFLRGSITGIDDSNFTPGQLILGVLHGMVEELKGYYDRMKPRNVTHLVASGNAVKRNEVLQRVLEDVFQKTIELTDNNEEAAIGSALYACALLQ